MGKRERGGKKGETEEGSITEEKEERDLGRRQGGPLHLVVST